MLARVLSRMQSALAEAWNRPYPSPPSPLRTVAGVLLLVLGGIGLALPVVPGWPFIVGAALCLGREHPYLRPFIRYIERYSRRSE